MNPSYYKLKNYQPVYNYGFDMARIKEIKYYLEHAIQNTKLDHLFIGLDFFMFNKYERLNYTFDETLVNNKISFIDLYFKPLLSLISLKDSFSTLKVSRMEKEREEFLSNGYRPAKNVFFGLKNYEKLHRSTNWIFLSSNELQTLYYAKMAFDNETLNDLKGIFEICQQNNITLTLYISPAHANLDGEGILAAGLYKDFESWKRKVTLLAFSYNLKLYDFSGYNFVTTEQVKTPMKNYWDSSHFTEYVGNEIWDVLTEQNESNEFGYLLTPKNIGLHIQKNREQMQEYHEKNEESLKDLHKMYEKALNGKRQDKESLKGMF
jgi:hypothetical protein